MDNAYAGPVEGHLELRLQDQTTLHPIERIHKKRYNSSKFSKDLALSNVYGSHMLIRLEMEKRILSRVQRLPGLESEFAGLDSMTGADLDIGFSDYLQGVEVSERPAPSMHLVMEHKLGIMKHSPQELRQ